MQQHMLAPMLLCVIMLLLNVEAVISEAIANTGNKEELLYLNADNLSDNRGKGSVMSEAKFHGNPILKLKRNPKSNSDRQTHLFHFTNSLNVHPSNHQHHESEVRQERVPPSDKLKSMIMSSLSNVKKFPKKLFELKKQSKGNSKPVLDYWKGKSQDFEFPSKHNVVHLGIPNKSNYRDGQQFSTTAVPPPQYSVFNPFDNFENEHHFRDSQDKTNQHNSITDSGVRAFHFQNIGNKMTPIFTPIFDHSVPVKVINHFQPDELFSFDDHDFNDYSSSVESNFQFSQESTDFKESNTQSFDGSRFIRLNHDLIGFGKPDSIPTDDVITSKDPNFNSVYSPTSYKHPDNQHIHDFRDFRDSEQRHQHGNIGNINNPGQLIRIPDHVDSDHYIYSSVNFDHMRNQGSIDSLDKPDHTHFIDLINKPIRGSTSFKQLNKNPNAFEYSEIRSAEDFTGSGDSRFHHSKYGPIDNSADISNPQKKESQELTDNYSFYFNPHHHEIKSIRRPNFHQIHLYEFIKPRGSHKLKEVSLFPNTDGNSNIKYYSDLSSTNFDPHPDYISSSEYQINPHLRGFIDPPDVEIIPFGLDDRIPHKEFENIGSNEGYAPPGVTSFVPAEGAREAIQFEHTIIDQSREKSHNFSASEDFSRFHDNKANGNENYDLGSEIFKSSSLHHQDVDEIKLRTDEQNPLLTTHEETPFAETIHHFNSTIHDINLLNHKPQITKSLTIKDIVDKYAEAQIIGKSVDTRDDSTKNVEDFSGLKNSKSTTKKLEPLCYVLPESYISYPPYTKSKLVCP